MRKKSLDRKLLSKILIIAGALCFAVLIGYELATYPWGTARADGSTLISADMPDPSAPPFEFELMTPPPDWRPTSFNNTAALPNILPGLPATGINASFVSYDPENTAVSRTGNVAVGILKIARLGLSEWVWEGTGAHQLKEGIGHVTGTAFPNEEGNVALSAHRTSLNKEPFRHLDKVQIDDFITLKFWEQNYNYQVFDIMVVGAHDAWVMDPVHGEDQVLTLITCDPLVWAGHRPNRLVVHARLVDITDAE